MHGPAAHHPDQHPLSAEAATSAARKRVSGHTAYSGALRLVLIIAACFLAAAAGLTAVGTAHAQEDDEADEPRGNIAERAWEGYQDDRDDIQDEMDTRSQAEECEGLGRFGDECQEEGDRVTEGPEGSENGFSRTAGEGEPSYKAYDLDNYRFAFFVAEEGNIIFNSDQSAQNALSDAFNGLASKLFVDYVVVMRGAFVLLEWVLTLNLVEDLDETISGVITNLGENLIGGPGTFSVAVKLVWAIGMAVVLAHIFRARVASALATALTMIGITALTAMIILAPYQVINWYTGLTNDLSNEVLSWATPEGERSGGDDAVSEDFLDSMWEAYVIVPFGYIQVSSETETAAKYDEQAVATPPDEQRVNALEEIEDEPGVEDRAVNSAWTMHLVWAFITLVFGLAMAALLIAAASIVLVFEFIAIVALMTLPFWLLLAIIPAGGMPRQMIGWFLNINLDVILAHLILALFVALSKAVLTVETGGEDIMLLTRFLLSLGAGIAVIMLIFSLRSVVQASSFGRSGMLERGGLHHKGGAGVTALAASRGLFSTAAGSMRGGSSSSDSGGTGPVHSEVSKRDGLLNRAGGANIDQVEKEHNEADRKTRGEQPLDSRSKKRKAAAAAAAATGSIAWKGTKAGAGALGKVGKTAAKIGGRLPKAGLIAARSGFMPMETAAAFGGIAAAGVAGGAYGAAGAGKDKAKQGTKGIASRFRQFKQDRANTERFTEDGEELTEKTANRKFDDDSERYDNAEESARQAYLDQEQPASAAAGGQYPSQAPPGTPRGATYDPSDGTITMDAKPDEETPSGPAGYSRSTQTKMTPGQAPREQHVWTPKKDAATMRGEAYDKAEKERRAQREELYKSQGPSSSGAWVTDANGKTHRDYASPAERARDAREDRMRDDQRDGIVAAGGSNFDEYHATNKQHLAANPPRKQDNESQQNFDKRKAAHDRKVRNYDPSRHAPPTAFSSSNPSLQEIKQKDSEGFKKYSEPRLNQEFSADHRDRVEEGRRRRDNPNDKRVPYDQVGYMETSRADVKDGIRRGDSDGSIITGQKEPEGSGPQMRNFQDRLRRINDSWLKAGPRKNEG